MNIEEIKTIGIIGSGTMGRGIAISASTNGYDTILYDVNNEILQNTVSHINKELSKSVEKKKITEEKKTGALNKIKVTSDFNELSQCEFIIEAALEDLSLKKEIFSRLNNTCNSNTIFSSNTSSLSITAISTAVKTNPQRVVGMHFFNPANIMKLVEVVKGSFTSEETVDLTLELSKKLGKIPVVAKDTPAFIVNRIARPFYGEALKILSEGSASVKEIDKVMKNCGGFAMGPFELMDLIGIDINFSVTKSVFEAFFYDPKYRPSFIQKNMVEANLLGRKTKKGFYDYE